jgi:hypothetical protein
MATININKTTYSGKNIVITNGKVVIDGKDVTEQEKLLTITIQGDVEKLEVDACKSIEITGNANNVRTSAGDVNIKGEVKGNVSTQSGDVECGGGIGGSVSTMSGDVECGGEIMGSVSTMSGDIN